MILVHVRQSIFAVRNSLLRSVTRWRSDLLLVLHMRTSRGGVCVSNLAEFVLHTWVPTRCFQIVVIAKTPLGGGRGWDETKNLDLFRDKNSDVVIHAQQG